LANALLELSPQACEKSALLDTPSATRTSHGTFPLAQSAS
jgi:hypothetical protein